MPRKEIVQHREIKQTNNGVKRLINHVKKLCTIPKRVWAQTNHILERTAGLKKLCMTEECAWKVPYTNK